MYYLKAFSPKLAHQIKNKKVTIFLEIYRVAIEAESNLITMGKLLIRIVIPLFPEIPSQSKSRVTPTCVSTNSTKSCRPYYHFY